MVVEQQVTPQWETRELLVLMDRKKNLQHQAVLDSSRSHEDSQAQVEGD